MLQSNEIEVDLGHQTLTFQTGKIARQANGAVLVRCGDTLVFTSACAQREPSETADFLPLRVDYQEKFSSAGKTLQGFIKREGRPTERETLVSRLTDRSLRPLFPEGFYNEVQVLSYVWSYDEQNSPDPLSICAASAALLLSEVPLTKAVAGVRVGRVDGHYIVNPTVAQQADSDLDLMLAGTKDAILMIEGFCDFLTEEEVIKAIETGHESIRKICTALEQWREQVGKEKWTDVLRPTPKETLDAVAAIAEVPLGKALSIREKQDREEALSLVKEKVMETLFPEGEELSETSHSMFDVKVAYKAVSSRVMRKQVLDSSERCDGRSPTEIRPIVIEQGLLPRTHGSSLFTRGETQTMAVCTLGGGSSAQRYETIEEEGSRKFYMQYFFPPFSVGEVGRVGPAGRREVGHGKLAERALQAIIPDQDKFPYTIRLESNITESNGSSSMASVCGGCLSMMDAGVPIERPIAGIAMGLILEEERHLILSDILGVEDALGDMDFKVTGDHKGVTAFQMDIKVEGITPAIMRAALEQAKAGRVHILDKMLAVCPQSRSSLSVYAPRIETIQLKPSKIGIVIGPGGKQIRAIIDETGVEIDIDDSGLVCIASNNAESMERAKAIIEGLTEDVQIGKIYQGKVVSIVPFGLFVEVLPGKEGLCHISELSEQRVENIQSFTKEGEILPVKVLDINERGQLKLSHKAAKAAVATS